MWAMEYSRDEGLRKYWDEYSYPYHKEGAGPQTYQTVFHDSLSLCFPNAKKSATH